jgi:hypothetical protein
MTEPLRAARWPLAIFMAAMLLALAGFIFSGRHVDQRLCLPVILCASFILWCVLGVIAIQIGRLDFRRLPSSAARQTVIAILILILAIGSRVAILVWWTPSLSDDILRYRQEGRLLLADRYPGDYLPADSGVRVSPFTGQPLDAAPFPTDELDRHANNAFLPTMYFPLSHLDYLASAWLEAHTISAPLPSATQTDRMTLLASPHLMPYRVVSVALDVFTVGLLLALLLMLKRSAYWGLLYAISPLPLIEVAGNGHAESIGLIGLLSGIFFAHRKRNRLAAAAFALAFLAKPIAAFALPALLIAAWQTHDAPLRFRVLRSFQLLAIWTAVVFAGSLPEAAHLAELRRTLAIISGHYYHNGFFFELFRYFYDHSAPGAITENTWSIRGPLAFCGVVAQLALFALAFRFRWPLLRTLAHCFLVYLLFSVLLYPWYVLWLLVLIPLAWNRAAWVLSFSILLSYTVHAQFAQTGQWEIPAWALCLEWVPVIVLLLIDIFSDCRSAPAPVQPSPIPPTATGLHGV